MKCPNDATEMIIEGKLGNMLYHKDACWCCPKCGKTERMFRRDLWKRK